MGIRSFRTHLIKNSLPQGEQVLREGLRLAGWNFGYIVCCMAVAIGLIGLVTLFPKITLLASIFLALAMAAAAGICYLMLWVRFAGHFACLVREKKALKTFCVSLLGVIPNAAIIIFLPNLFRLLAGNGSADDICGGVLFYGSVYLIFICSTLAMPVVGLLGAAMRKAV